MRILLALLAVIVFGTMLLVDTAALVRLATSCVTGGCGVRPLWIAVGGGGVVAAVAVLGSLRQSQARSVGARPTRRSSPQQSRGKDGPERKRKSVKRKSVK
jgi:hypothetical protein